MLIIIKTVQHSIKAPYTSTTRNHTNRNKYTLASSFGILYMYVLSVEDVTLYISNPCDLIEREALS